MLKIRLQRVGRKHDPVFRIVLTDSRNGPKSGKFLEVLGSYDPRRENDQINEVSIKKWLSHGAQPSESVHNLLVKHKIIEGKKINVLPKKSPIRKEKEEELLKSGSEDKPTDKPTDKPIVVEEVVQEKQEESPVEEEKTETDK